MKTPDFRDLIVFENDHYLVINKPPHISTLDERFPGTHTPIKEGNILRWAKDRYPDAQVGHRLDKETSGALAIAKHPQAYRHLAVQFEDRTVEKVYHAVTDGLHHFEGVSVYLPIFPMGNGKVKIDREKGKLAETIFQTLAVYKRHTLVECRPLTGRMHQIRVHLLCLKASIVMDDTYGGKPIFLSEIKRNFSLKKTEEEQPLIGRVALHAFRLGFADLDGTPIVAEAPYPKDMRALVRQLAAHV